MTYVYKHVGAAHSTEIPNEISIKQFVFNKKNRKDKGSCVICGRETPWNDDMVRYERYDSESCRKEAGRRAKENMKKKYGKEHLLDDPAMQKKMQENRSISGHYAFRDGGTVQYLGSYEHDFLEFNDTELNMSSNFMNTCYEEGISIYYFWKNPDTDKKEKKFYVPDYYIKQYNLIIEIKDGGDNPNNHPKIQRIDKSKEKAKDRAIKKTNYYNYIKIVNKDYVAYTDLLSYLKENYANTAEKKQKPIIIV